MGTFPHYYAVPQGLGKLQICDNTPPSEMISDRATWLDIIRKFASTLIHVHDVGFLHNDIKANNVLLDIIDGAFTPVIIDFGPSLPMGSAKGPSVVSQETKKVHGGFSTHCSRDCHR